MFWLKRSFLLIWFISSSSLYSLNLRLELFRECSLICSLVCLSLLRILFGGAPWQWFIKSELLWLTQLLISSCFCIRLLILLLKLLLSELRQGIYWEIHDLTWYLRSGWVSMHMRHIIKGSQAFHSGTHYRGLQRTLLLFINLFYNLPWFFLYVDIPSRFLDLNKWALSFARCLFDLPLEHWLFIGFGFSLFLICSLHVIQLLLLLSD